MILALLLQRLFSQVTESSLQMISFNYPTLFLDKKEINFYVIYYIYLNECA
jgi:hypothetical protein